MLELKSHFFPPIRAQIIRLLLCMLKTIQIPFSITGGIQFFFQGYHCSFFINSVQYWPIYCILKNELHNEIFFSAFVRETNEEDKANNCSLLFWKMWEDKGFEKYPKNYHFLWIIFLWFFSKKKCGEINLFLFNSC